MATRDPAPDLVTTKLPERIGTLRLARVEAAVVGFVAPASRSSRSSRSAYGSSFSRSSRARST